MPEHLPFYNWSLKKVLDREEDPIDRARIKMVFYSLILGVCITGALTLYYFVADGPRYQLVRAAILFPLFLVMLKLHLARNVWRQVMHVGLIILTVQVLINITVNRAISVVTVQYTILVISYGLYGLGKRWGIIYSLLNIFLIAIFLVFGQEHYDPVRMMQLTGKPAFIAVMLTNFGLIFLTHYLFYSAFSQSIRQLREAVKVKSDFMSTMSHELRTPLNAVIGMSNLMIGDDGQNQKENLRILKFSAENLLTVVNDVLDFSKIESGMIEMEEIGFNLNALVRNICAGMRLQATEKQLELRLETAPELDRVEVLGDPSRFTQILFNLVGNAIKFTREGSVTVRCRVISESKSTIVIHCSVIDTGIGISKDKQQLIFQPFMQASRDTTREFGGTGLGLSIVNHLLLLFNSEIQLRSALGEGSTFSFSIPFKKGRELVTGEVNEVPDYEPGRAVKILIAEDNAINVLLMRKLLQKWWQVDPVIAGNGAEALAQAAQQHFDLILMDMHMPVMDGYQSVREIRALPDPSKASVYIVALTASVSSFSNQSLDGTGVNDYVSKPFNPDQLREKLERVLFRNFSASSAQGQHHPEHPAAEAGE